MSPFRLIGFVLAVAIAFVLALSGKGTDDWLSAITGPRGWLAGIAAGLLAAWLFGIEWRSLPGRFRALASYHRRDLGWSAVAACSLVYLVAG